MPHPRADPPQGWKSCQMPEVAGHFSRVLKNSQLWPNLWLLLKIISENIGVNIIVWSRDLTFPWQPSFERSFDPNLVFSFTKSSFQNLYSFCSLIFFLFFQIKCGDFLTFLNNLEIQGGGRPNRVIMFYCFARVKLYHTSKAIKKPKPCIYTAIKQLFQIYVVFYDSIIHGFGLFIC